MVAAIKSPKREAEVKVMQWGNSLAIRIPMSIAKRVSLNKGTCLDMVATAEGFRVKKRPCGLTLEDIVSRITEQNRHELENWGPDVGNEMWEI